MNRRSLALLVLVLLPCAAGAAEPPVQVRSSVDRTAAWVADRVTYTVEIRTAPGTDILLDDLAKEKLRLNGFDIVSSDASAATDASDRTTHTLRYVLTTYRVDTPMLSIEPISVRYYARRPGQRLQDIAPAGEVTVPRAVVSFRSTLPDNQPTYGLRDARAAGTRGRLFSRADSIGLGLIVVSLAPALVLGAATIRRRTRGRTGKRSARQARADQRAALERLRTLDVGTEEERRRAYDEISAAVRNHVAARSGVPATALTATEIEEALAHAGGRVSREEVSALIAACDDARYAPADSLPSTEACSDARCECAARPCRPLRGASSQCQMPNAECQKDQGVSRYRRVGDHAPFCIEH